MAVGDVVKPGNLLVEIETDKATMDFEAIDDGRIASLVEVVRLFRQVGGRTKLPSWVLSRQFGFQIRWGMPHLI